MIRYLIITLLFISVTAEVAIIGLLQLSYHKLGLRLKTHYPDAYTATHPAYTLLFHAGPGFWDRFLEHVNHHQTLLKDPEIATCTNRIRLLRRRGYAVLLVISILCFSILAAA